MRNHRLSSLRQRSKRETMGFALATAGVIAVTASSAVSMADHSAPSKPAVVADQQPAADAPVAADTELAAHVEPIPAPAPAPEALPEPEPAPAPEPAPEPAPAPEYPDNLDGWIREAQDILAQHGIPGSYESIHRNILRESSGDPAAINLYDSNAAMGIPSKGLLQVIDPTFAAFHVPGTPFDVWDPVANIVAACNYAAQKYGSMDNIFGAY